MRSTAAMYWNWYYFGDGSRTQSDCKKKLQRTQRDKHWDKAVFKKCSAGLKKISPLKHTPVFCIHLCFCKVRWGLGSSLRENWESEHCCGIGAFSLGSKFSWLHHPFYILTGAVLDVHWFFGWFFFFCSPKPLNTQRESHLGKSCPAFGAHFLLHGTNQSNVEWNVTVFMYCEYMKMWQI